MLNINKILIVTGGKIESNFLRKYLKENEPEIIIAVDKGLAILDKIAVQPNYIVGDFDSISEEVYIKYRDLPNVYQYSPVKDETDTEIALNLAMDICCKDKKEIDILGATGTRVDHLLGNIHLLIEPLKRGLPCNIIDTNNKIYMKNSSFSIFKNKQYGDFISLIPFTESVEGIYLDGFKYKLENKKFIIGSPLGISNEIISEIAEIRFEKGILIIIESKD